VDGPASISPEHHELVRTLARGHVFEHKIKCEIQELEGYGIEGLLKAKKDFDPSRGVPFEGYAYYRIRWAIRDGVREMTALPRRVHESLRAAERADLAIEAAGERAAKEPTDGDFDAGAKTVDDLMGQVAAAHIATAAANAEATTEDSLITRMDAARLHKVIATLPDEARELLKLLYFEDRGLEATGAKLGVSKSEAFRRHGDVLALLRKKLT
jgi:RNA polymerase sigma factor FliA